MNFGSEHVYLYDSSDEEYILEEELSRGIELSLNIGDEEPKPKPRPLPGYGHSRQQRSITPPLRDETPQLVPVEDICEGSTTKYLCDQCTDEDDDDEKGEGNKEKDVQLKLSEGATASPIVKALPDPPPGILKKRPGRKHFGGMVQWMSWHDSGNFKYILKKYQPSLAEGISLPDLIPHLNYYHLLSDEENDVLLDGKLTHKERVLKLLSFIERKNTILYHNFLQALEAETNHPGHQQLAEMLRKATEKQEKRERGVRSRQVDTNVVAVTFDTLTGPAGVHTGDVVVCINEDCTAVLSHLSKVTGEQESDQKVWVCEFCGTKNEVDIVAEEIPSTGETTYLLTPPITSTGVESATPTVGMEETLLVFCIDTSGSMCVTTEVAGKVKLKSDDKLRRLSVSLKADIETQYMPRQSRNVTYISRLQSVQSAIDGQLTSLAKSHPSRRIALVSFSDEVSVMGDGRAEDVVVAGDKLSSVDALLKIGSELSLPTSISHSQNALAQKVSMYRQSYRLEEGGQTALGPALLLSVLLAGQVPGSKVIVCTDGLANKGLGSLDEMKIDEAFSAAQQFYKDLGDIALEKGVTVSVVTIKGEECRVMELGQVADATGGEVTRVDPSTVATEFSNIVSNPVIATNVACKLILHNRLYFRTEDVKGNVMCVPFGNVTADTEYSFEYGVKKSKSKSDAGRGGGASRKSLSTPPLMFRGKPHLPFQLQTEYTTADGSVLVRVITKVKPVTEDRQVAEKDIDMDVMGFHALRTSAGLAAEGKFSEARTGAIASQRMLKRSLERSSDRNTVKKASYNRTMSSIAPLEKTLREKQTRVKSLPVMHSDSGISSHSCPPRPPRLQSESRLKSAFEKTKSSTGEERRSKSLMSTGSVVTRRASSLATAALTSRQEAMDLRMESEDSLAAEIFHVKKLSSTRSSK